MHSEKKNLCLFTTAYPYGKQVETFIDSELDTMGTLFEKVYIFPSFFDDAYVRPLPSNFEIVRLDQNWGHHSKRIFYSNIFLIFKILFFEFLFTKVKTQFFRNLFKYKNTLVHSIFISESLANFVDEKEISNPLYYSYWLNEWTITLGILKEKNKISHFISRAHGFDIYEERRADKVIPFRYLQLKMVDCVFSVSQRGCNYLKGLNLFPQKITCSYLGVSDRGINPFDESQIFTIVSCSNLMPLKRVHLIIEILRKIKFPVSWVHFGDGDGNLLEEFKANASILPENIKYNFMGHVPNSDVLDFYKKTSVNLFVLLSESEGLPMSLIEASSFGIPLLATDVGGVSEIVNERTGILVPPKIDIEDVVLKIDDFRKGRYNTNEFRQGVKLFWAENFNDSDNYNNFYNRCFEAVKAN